MLKIILGVLFIVAAFVLMFAIIIPSESLRDNPDWLNLQASLVCNPGERFQQEIGTYIRSSGLSGTGGFPVYNTCIDANGSERDVNGQWIAINLGGFFGVPFVVGLLLLLWGIIASVRRSMKRVVPAVTAWDGATGTPGNIYTFDTEQPGQSATVVTINNKNARLQDLPPETARMVQQLLGSLTGAIGQMDATNQADLTDKLRQLQEARDANLISQSEYERLRQQILDNVE